MIALTTMAGERAKLKASSVRVSQLVVETVTEE